MVKYDALVLLTYKAMDNRNSVVAIGLISRIKYWIGLSTPKLNSVK